MTTNGGNQPQNAYVLGEEILDVAFKDTIIDSMAEKTHSGADTKSFWPSALVVSKIYAGTTSSSKARSLLTDFITASASSDAFATVKDDVPAEFVSDVAIRLLDQFPETLEFLFDPCYYHEHERGTLNCHLRHQVYDINDMLS